MLVINSVTIPPHNFYQQAEHTWNYLGKISVLSRQILNACIHACQCMTLRGRAAANGAVAKLKLLSIVGVPFTFVQARESAQKMLASMRFKDTEGVALNGLSFTLLSADIIDSLATFINAVLVNAAKAPSSLLSALGMPLGFALNGLGAFSRTIQIAKAHALFKKFTGRAVQEKEMEKLLHGAPKPVKEEMKNLVGHIKKGEQQEMVASLRKIRFLLQKKMVFDGGNLGANFLNLIALSLFFTAFPPSLPFLFLATALVFRIAALLFQDLT